MPGATLRLDGRSITLKVADRVLGGERFAVRLTRDAESAVRASRRTVQQRAGEDQAVYGVNTGFGKLSRVRIDAADLTELQQNLILSHATGVGDPLAPGVARLALLLRANALTMGHSGVRLELIRLLLDLFTAGVAPVIPSQGSVGASGDLAPLAHLALLLLGRGQGMLDGRRHSGATLLRRLGKEPLELEPKEGLALINGTQISTALAVSALLRSLRLARTADLALAQTIEAHRGSVKAFDQRIHAIRPHPGQVTVARNIRRLLRGSRIVAAHAGCDRVQDPYSIRCTPQVHGAARDTLSHVQDVLVREMNSVTDNPLIFPADGTILSGGNFHAEPVAMAADFLSIAVAELGSIAERRIEVLVNPDLSGLPPFLSPRSGLHSGFMITQVTAASLVSENKTLAHPASVDSIPTSAGKEDHVSMATWAARKVHSILDNVENILAIELLCGAQGIDLHEERLEPGRGAAVVYRKVRERVKMMKKDRELAADIASIRELVASGELLRAVGKID